MPVDWETPSLSCISISEAVSLCQTSKSPELHRSWCMQAGDAWTGSEYKMRLLSGLATKLHAKLGVLALQHNRLNAQHCTRLLDQVEDR